MIKILILVLENSIVNFFIIFKDIIKMYFYFNFLIMMYVICY